LKSPGAPTRRGAAGLRLEGRHTGKVRVPAARLDVAGPTLASNQGGREEVKMVTAALTSGRRCRRGRLGERGHVGEVDVHGGGSPSSGSWLTVGFPSLRRGVAAASLLFSSPSAYTEERESKTPMGLVAWAVGVSASSLAFEVRRRERRHESPALPPV
jgi:hypothetical protein